MIPDSARRRIEALAASPDPLDREVARRLAGQLRRIAGPSSTTGGDGRPRSRWPHVDLADLFAQFGNPVRAAGEHLKAGHEPVHGSRSGTCVVAWPETGRWWCSSCLRSGDAAALVMQARGVRYAEAARWLSERYGPPPGEVRGIGRRATPRYNPRVRRVVLGGVSHG